MMPNSAASTCGGVIEGPDISGPGESYAAKRQHCRRCGFICNCLWEDGTGLCLVSNRTLSSWRSGGPRQAAGLLANCSPSSA